MKFTSVLTGGAVAAAVLVGGSTAAVAAPQPIDFPPLDQATIVDPDSVTPAKGGLLTADGTNVCATTPERIAYADDTRPCFTGSVAIPGGRYPLNPIILTPFDEATVVDPTTVTIIQGGVITADGTDLCAVNPGSIVFPDGRYPCYINFVQTYGTYPTPEEGLYDTPQVGQLPVGGADTGVRSAASGDANTATFLGASILALGVLAAGNAIGRQARCRQ